MTVHTITLEDQHKPSVALGTHPAHRPKPRHERHNRCQHEARGASGIVRQCRNRSVTVVDGQRLCRRHAFPD